ncbi:MAG: MFS transporter [Gammaproteobacteria bacterium]|nr:MAG: MFS transporter [Gammaproteobacteria bacterium]
MSEKSIKTYLVIWLGQFMSMFGTTMTGYSLGVWLLKQDNSVANYSLVLFAVLTPSMLFAPIAGVLIDRFNRKAIMIAGHACAGLCSLGIIVLYFCGMLRLGFIVPLVAISSVCNGMVNAAFMASTSLLVSKDNLTRASGLMGIARALITIAAPPFAILLLDVFGLKLILSVDVVSFLFAIICFSLTSIPQPQKNIDDKKNIVADLLFGVRYILKNRSLLHLLLFFMVVVFFVGLANASMPPFVMALSGEKGVSVVFACAGVGALIGASFLATVKGIKNHVLFIIAAAIIFGAGLVVVSFSKGLLLIAIAFFVVAAIQITAIGANQVIWQKKVEPEYQGRVLTTAVLFASITLPVALLLAGPVVSYIFKPLSEMLFYGVNDNGEFGYISLMFLCNGVILIAVAIIALFNPFIRNIEANLEDKV